MKILAGITLYEPDIARLDENLIAIHSQVKEVICIDNGSKNVEKIEKFINEKYPKVVFVKNQKNQGIAKALNQIFSYGKERGYEWVLTLDQDSISPRGMIDEYMYVLEKAKENNIRVGIISPVIVDRNFDIEMESNQEKNDNQYKVIDKCITSASLTSVRTWEEVGGFWEYLFIDFVDHDFCAKCQKAQIIILRANRVQLLHELGNGVQYMFLGRRVTALNHTPFRKYYMVRNWLIYMHVHKTVIDYKSLRNSYRFFYLKTLLFEKQKIRKLQQMLKGRKDGKKFIKTMDQ